MGKFFFDTSTRGFLNGNVLLFDSFPREILWIGKFYFSTALQAVFFEWGRFIFPQLSKGHFLNGNFLFFES
jgi:hypothetical protein